VSSAAEALPDLKVHLYLPLRTESQLNGQHGHWATRARRTKAHRITARLKVLSWFDVRMLAMGPCRVTLTRVAPRALDGDNLQGALKAVRDGVADALGVNDADPRVTWAYAQRRGKAREYAVLVEIAP
jgi:hypothetical protein